MSDVAPAELQPGAAFLGRYEILRCMKAGGMGAVYEVVHLETRRRRALKVMLPTAVTDPDLRARFRLEATITAEIDSEHIVETFDAGIDPDTGAPFLVMELLKGDDVAGHLERRGRLPGAEVVALLRQLAAALEKTHAAGIVHRDLKPENLFVTRRDDGSPRLKVLDFGIAKIVAQSTPTAATRSMGTPFYMAPEQLGTDGRLGPAADLYAVGHIAYAMLVGHTYWEDDPALEGGVWPLLVKVMAGAEEAASARAARRGVELPGSFDAWFTTATARNPGERFHSALAMVSALADALGVAPAVTVQESTRPPPSVVSLPAPLLVDAQTAPSALASTLQMSSAGGEVRVRAAGTFAPTSDPPAPTPTRSPLPFVVGALLIAGLGGTAAVVLGGHQSTPSTEPPSISPVSMPPPLPAPSRRPPRRARLLSRPPPPLPHPHFPRPAPAPSEEDTPRPSRTPPQRSLRLRSIRRVRAELRRGTERARAPREVTSGDIDARWRAVIPVARGFAAAG